MTPILGVDLSAHNWRRGLPTGQVPKLKAAGIRLVIARASIGTAEDASFAPTLNRVRAQGWQAGAYHYLEPGDGAAQAATFCAAIPDDIDGLLTVLDVEQSGVRLAGVAAFAARFAAIHPRHRLGLYTSYGAWGRYGNHDAADLGMDWLWLAYYTWTHDAPPIDVPPAPPHGLGGLPVSIWQGGPFVIDGHRLDGDAAYVPLAPLAATADRPPLTERRNYRRCYDARIDLIVQAIATMSPASEAGHPACRAGDEQALEDAADAVAGLRIREVA